MVLRLLILKHVRNWSYEVLEREVRANLVYRDFTRVGGGKMPDAKTMGRWGEMVPRVQQVMKQARARIYRGDTHAEGKIVSLFEPSTEVIRKGKAAKPNEFGKMIKLQEAENQIVIDYEVYARTRTC